MKYRLMALLVAAVACCAGLPSAHAQTIDSAKSLVTISFKQMGVTVDAKFRKVTGQVQYDPAQPAAATAKVDIDVASFDLGDAQYNKEVLKQEWFDASKYPTASFVSSSITPTGPGRFDAAGKLTIKGRTNDVKLPVTVKTEAGAHVFEGSLPIKRLTYAIGEGEWKDTSMVADEVVIRFKLVTPIVPPSTKPR